MKFLARYFATTFLFLFTATAFAQSVSSPQPLAAASVSRNQDYLLGAGDAIGVQVYQNPDLSVDARVSESGVISYPLVGSVQVGGLTISEAEKKNW